jgi:hypothetical protein
MTVKQVREHLEHRPFRPITLRTIAGSRHVIPHREYLLIPPIGDCVFAVEKDGTIHILDVDQIEAVEVTSQRQKRGK